MNLTATINWHKSEALRLSRAGLHRLARQHAYRAEVLSRAIQIKREVRMEKAS